MIWHGISPTNVGEGCFYILTESSEVSFTSTEVLPFPIPGCEEAAPGWYFLGGIEPFTDGKIAVNTSPGTTVVVVRDTTNPIESTEACETGKCKFTNKADC